MDNLLQGSFGFNVRQPKQTILQNQYKHGRRRSNESDSDSDITLVEDGHVRTPRIGLTTPKGHQIKENIESRPSTGSSLWDTASTSSLSWAEDEIENQSTREVQRLLDQLDSIVFEGVKPDPFCKLDLAECQEWRSLYLQLRDKGLCPTIRRKLCRPKLPPARLSVLPVQRQVQSAIITPQVNRSPQYNPKLLRTKSSYNGSERPATVHHKPLEESFQAMALSPARQQRYATPSNIFNTSHRAPPPSRSKLKKSWLAPDSNQNQLPPIESRSIPSSTTPFFIPQVHRRLQSAQPVRFYPPPSNFRPNPQFVPRFIPNLTSLRENQRKPPGEESKPEFFMNVVGKAVHREVRARRPSRIKCAIHR